MSVAGFVKLLKALLCLLFLFLCLLRLPLLLLLVGLHRTGRALPLLDAWSGIRTCERKLRED